MAWGVLLSCVEGNGQEPRPEHQGIWNTFFSLFWLPPCWINPGPLPGDDVPLRGVGEDWYCICQSLEEAEQLSEKRQQHNFLSPLLLDKGPAPSFLIQSGI